MKAQELREKNVEDLKNELVELTKKEFELKFANKTGKLDKPHTLKEVRRDIAHVKTVITEKAGQ